MSFINLLSKLLNLLLYGRFKIEDSEKNAKWLHDLIGKAFLNKGLNLTVIDNICTVYVGDYEEGNIVIREIESGDFSRIIEKKAIMSFDKHHLHIKKIYEGQKRYLCGIFYPNDPIFDNEVIWVYDISDLDYTLSCLD